MGFIETSYGGKPNLSDVNIDSILNMGNYGITASGYLNILNTMNLNNNDLVGVKRFMCEDYLGAVQANASDDMKWTLILNDVTTLGARSKKFRVPSNFVNSTINMKFYATNSTGSNHAILLEKYDPETQTYTTVFSVSIPANTTSPTEFNIPTPITVKAGELYDFFTSTAGGTYFYGSMGVKIMCDISPFTSAYWEVEE